MLKTIKYFLIAIHLVLLTSCNTKPEITPSNINGYWEIEEVVLPNGGSHVYKVNETVDYFYINDSLSGFRQKMKPGLNNQYKPVTAKEEVKLIIINDSIQLHYQTPFAKWKETILELNNNRLKVVNQHNNVYIYKRFIPLNL